MLRVGLTGDLGSGKTTVARLLAQRGAVVFYSDEMARAMMQPGEEVYAAIVAHFGPEILGADRALDRSKLAALAFDATHPRVEELNAIVHPAVIQAQEEQIAAIARQHAEAIVVVESALIFSTNHNSISTNYNSTSIHHSSTHYRSLEPRSAGDNSSEDLPASQGSSSNQSGAASAVPAQLWRSRFDCILLVLAPQQEKLDRFVRRMAAGRELSKSERITLEEDATHRLALQNSAAHAAECIVIANDQGIAQLEQQVNVVWHELQHREQIARLSTGL